VAERTAVLSEFWQSGIIDNDPGFAAIASQGGQVVTMPFWQDLVGNSQVLSDTGALTTKKIGAVTDAAVIHQRGDAWSYNDLARFMSGSDPGRQIADFVAAYWARDNQTILLSMLTGLYGAGSSPTGTLATTNNLDIFGSGTLTTANYLTGSSYIDAKMVMGDASAKLGAIAMHSKTLAYLMKSDLISFIKPSEGAPTINTFQGARVIVDDRMTVEVINTFNVYSTFIFGTGAIALGEDTRNEQVNGGFGDFKLEFTRVPLAHQNIMIMRRRFLLHLRGVKFLNASMAGLSPTNAELSSTNNWSRVYEAKNVRVVRVRHNNP
jgi:hypothetical protein